MVRLYPFVMVLSVAGACGGHGSLATDAGVTGDDGGNSGGAALAVAPGSLDLGSVRVQSTSPVGSLTFTNGGDAQTDAMTAVLGGANAAAFTLVDTTCAGTLAAGASCVAHVRFAPTAVGATSAMLAVSDGATTATADLTGIGTSATGMQIVPSLHDYQTVGVGSTDAFTFNITNGNAGVTGALAVSITGANPADFTPSGSCMGATLQPSAACTVTIAFKPGATGARAGTLSITGSPGGTVTASLVGTGIQTSASLVVTPTPWDFGNVRIGDSSFGKMFTISHPSGATTGALALSITGTHIGDFVKTADNCNGQTLAAGGSCTVFVSFEPGAVGPRNGRLTIAASPGGTVDAELSGTCTATAQ